MKKRSIIVYTFIIILFSVCCLKLLSIITSNLSETAISQSSMSLTVDKARGTIYDCNLKRITNTTEKYVAAISPTPEAIAALLKLPDGQTAIKRLQSGKPIIMNLQSKLHETVSGITVFSVYQHNSDTQLAPHIIGYLNDSGNGISGIEKSYDNILKCENPLAIRYTTDSRGRIISGVTPEISGNSSAHGIALTIDMKIQKILEKAASRYIKTGAAVVLEVSTGKIKACVSLPTFSPNNISASLKNADSPLINRAFIAFNTGSVFKLCLASAAIEAGILPTYRCNSKIKIGSVTFNCHKSHGLLGLKEALSVSCNTYFINLGQKLGADTVYKMAQNYGFGYSLQLCNALRSDAGKLPNLGQISEQPAALANFSFGQGDLLTTPLQIASMCQTIANGGKKITPSLIEGVVNDKGELEKAVTEIPFSRILKKSSADTLSKYMINVVEHGTGIPAKPTYCGAGGKTATAESGWIVNGRPLIQAWFAGFFPSDKPKYAIAIIVQNGISGSVSAGPVFKEFADELKKINMY